MWFNYSSKYDIELQLGGPLYPSATITFYTEGFILHNFSMEIMLKEGSLHHHHKLCHAILIDSIWDLEIHGIENEPGWRKDMFSLTRFPSFHFPLSYFSLQNFVLLLLFPGNSGQLAYSSIGAISAIKHPRSIGKATYSNRAVLVLKVQAIGP